MRHKEIHGLKCHPSIKFAVDFALSQMNEKMKKRVFLHRRVEDVVSVIDRNLLPLEYGGKTTMSEMIELFKKELVAKRDMLLSHDEMRVNLESYPQSVRLGSVRALKVPLDTQDKDGVGVGPKEEMMGGLSGSFRKLEID